MSNIILKLPSVVNSYKLHENVICHTAKEYKKESYLFAEENECFSVVNIKTKEKNI